MTWGKYSSTRSRVTARDVPPRLPRRLALSRSLRRDRSKNGFAESRDDDMQQRLQSVSGYVTAAGRRRCPAGVLDGGAGRNRRKTSEVYRERVPRDNRPIGGRHSTRRWDRAIARDNEWPPRAKGTI